jgi:hypothetical protein
MPSSMKGRRRAARSCRALSANRSAEGRCALARAEALERRTLLSVAPATDPFLVHTMLPYNQNTNAGGRDVAADRAGNFVAVWQSYGQGQPQGEIYARRFNASGAPLGDEFHVNTVTNGDQGLPAVAMNGDGRFVIAWIDRGEAGTFSHGVVTARVYDPAGRPVGGEVRVSPQPPPRPGTRSEGSPPAAAMDDAGNFVLAWAEETGGGWNMFACRFDAWGAPRGNVFPVNNDDGGGDQFFPDVACDGAGNFTIVFVDSNYDGDQAGVFARRYDASGAPLGGQFVVNATTAGHQLDPSVAIDPDGDAVVAWTTYQRVGVVGPTDGVYARRFDRAGNPAGGEFRVSADHGGGKLALLPSVSLDAAGDFVVAYSAADADDFGVYARRFAADGTAGDVFPVNTYTASVQRNPSVAMDADGDFVITFSSYAQANPFDYGVYARVYAESRDALPPSVLGVTGASTAMAAGGRVVHPLSQLVVAFSEDLVAAGPDSVTNTANWSVRGGGFGAEPPSAVTFARNAAIGRYEATLQFSRVLPSMEWVLTAEDVIRDAAGNRLDGDGDGTPGGDLVLPFTVAVPVIPPGSDVHVNTYTNGPQQTRGGNPRSVATDAAGNFVVAFAGDRSDNRTDGDVFVRRFDRHGNPLTDVIPVTDSPFIGEAVHCVASDAAGNFIVIFGGLMARRYNAAGEPLEQAWRVNTFPAGNPAHGRVAMDPAGNFVIAWSSEGQDGSGMGIYARRFDAAARPLGPEFRVNTFTDGNQYEPTIAGDAYGRFVVAWTSTGQDGSGDGVYAQSFDAAGQSIGGEFKVGRATETAGPQNRPAAGMDGAGRVVVTFIHNNQAYAHWFALNGLLLAGGPVSPNGVAVKKVEVAMSPAGDAVIVWDWLFTHDIWARRYGPGGVPVGEPFAAKPYEGYVSDAPSVATDPAGNFVIAYTLRVPDSTNDEVFVRRFIAPPIADVVDVAPDPRAGPVDQVTVRFTEPVTGVDLSDFTLTYFPSATSGGTDVPLTAEQTLTRGDGGATYMLGNLTPLTRATGFYWLELRNGAGIASLGGMPLAARAMDSWSVPAPAARVVGRFIFYNRSSFDGNNAAADAADDAAIATDKDALLAGQDRLPGFDNVTSYDKGINGVIIDVMNLPQDANLIAADFDFGAALRPVSVTVRRAAGTGGSDRVTLIWTDYSPGAEGGGAETATMAVGNGWLTVTMKSNAHTGLAQADVFSFGNLIGETGDAGATSGWRVNALDLAAVKRALNATASVTNTTDFNRDGRTNALDLAVVKRNLNRALPLPTAAPAQAVVAAVAESDDKPAAATNLLRE